LDYDFEPYFFVLPKKGKEKELKKKIEQIKSIKIKRAEIVERIILGNKRKFVKVFCFLSTDVPKVRDIVKEWKGLVEEEYEYSISFYKRYLIDKQIDGMSCIEVEGKEIKGKYQADKIIKIKSIKPAKGEIPKLKLMSFDIECVEEKGKQKIVMLSLKGKSFEKVLTYQKDKYPKYVEIVKNEEELLERFVEIIQKQDPDILLGYNSDAFDFQVLRERAEEYPKFKLILSRDKTRMKFARRARISSAKLKGRIHIDLFDFINNILSPQLQTEVLTLDAVSAELLNDRKIEMDYEEILESWRKKKDLAKLAEYCLKDSELTLRLGEFILPQIFEISKISGQLPFDASRMTYSQLVEWYLSKKAFIMNHIIPNQPKWDEIQKRREYSPYIGGFVKEPIGGLHEEIAVMDFKSLYPSIIATFNISPETFNCSCCRKNGYEVPERKYWFCKKSKGFVSTVIKELIEKRSEIKNS
jgi:DNA polymerase elongation subunit (family B)